MVKLVAQVKLRPTPEQAASLAATIRRANEACEWLSTKAWEAKVFRQFALHKLAYYECRAAFPDLSSQVVARSIAKVAAAYKLDRLTKRRFRPLGSIAYDARILSWKGDAANACGHTTDADVNAARVIARRAEVIRPYAGNVEVVVSHGVDLQSSAL